MKKILLLLCLILFLSCEYVPVTEKNIWEFDVPEEATKCKDLKELNKWVHEYLKYKYDEIEMFRTPKEIIKRKKEDCDGYVILFVGLAYQLFNKKINCAKVFVNNKKFGPYHKVAVYNKKIYDPTWDEIRNFANENICYIAEFEEIEYWIKFYRWRPLK